MTETSPPARSYASGPALVSFLAAFKLVVHLVNPGGYGLFVDELYFLACGEHLDWGYVDMPPLTALQAWLARALFGDSLLAIRLLPALAGAGLVLLTGAIVRELGGGRAAQLLAALAVTVAPFYLLFHSFLSMNALEPLFWTGCAFVLIRIVRTGETRLWLWFGVLAGIGLESKHTIAVFAFAVVLGLLLTPERRLMANRWFLLAGAIAFLIFLPNLVWMVRHHFPHLEQLANIRRAGRNVRPNPIQFLGLQAFGTHPVAVPLWLAGLGSFLVSRNDRRYRALGLAYLVALGTLLVTAGRFYYLASVYPMLLAAGAVALEKWAARPRGVLTAYTALLAVTGLLGAPIALPILPPEAFILYSRAIGISQPRIENRTASELPQLFADRFGWPEMAEAVAKVYNALPPEERAKTAIFAQDYGQAGAIDFYGPRLGLPKALSGHLTYWYWGPRGYSGEIMLVLGDRRERLEQLFEDVEKVGTVGHPYAMASQQWDLHLCREPKGWTLTTLWPRLKKWG